LEVVDDKRKYFYLYIIVVALILVIWLEPDLFLDRPDRLNREKLIQFKEERRKIQNIALIGLFTIGTIFFPILLKWLRKPSGQSKEITVIP